MTLETLRSENIEFIILANKEFATFMNTKVSLKLSENVTRESKVKLVATINRVEYFPVTDLAIGKVDKLVLVVTHTKRLYLEAIKNSVLPISFLMRCRDGSIYTGSEMYIEGSLDFDSSKSSLSLTLIGDLNKSIDKIEKIEKKEIEDNELRV